MTNKNCLKSIKLSHFNINGLLGHFVELKDFIDVHNIDIMLLNETKISAKRNIKLSGYDCIRKDRNDLGTGGGVMILIRNTIKYHEIDLQTKSIETVGIKLGDGSVIVSGYKPPQGKIDIKDLDIIFNTANKVLLYGDFNAKNTLWNCHKNNSNGKILFDFVSKKLFEIHYPESYTLYPYSDAMPSTVDIGISKNFNNNIQTDILDELDSDHLPVLISISNVDNLKLEEQTFLNYNKANWEKFQRNVNENLRLSNNLNTKVDIENSVDEFVSVIQNAMSKSIPKIKIKQNIKFVSDEIRLMISDRNKLRKIYQSTRSIEVKKIKNKLTNSIRRKIFQYNNDRWNEKLESLTVKDNSLWKMAKCLTKKNNNSIPILHGLNGLALSNEDRVEEIANNFEKVHRLTQDMSDYDTEKLINRKYREIRAKQIDKNDIVLVSPREIKKAVLRTKSKKAPGLDNIQNIVLKQLPKKAFVQLTYIFNACFEISYFPSVWKKARILPFHKPGKDKLFPQSYRPISLLPTLSKVYEKIILNRIKDFELANNLLIPQQFGFREKRNTVQQLFRVTNHISTNFNIKKSTAMVLLDIEKAFDTVWHEGLIYKLQKYNFPLYIIKIIQNYLKNRTFIVTANKTDSNEKTIEAGVPQGSILGPVLFILYINEIPKSDEVKLSLFADDTAVYVSSLKLSLAVKKLQNYLEVLLEFFDKWKLKVNSAKTELVYFKHLKRKESVPDFYVDEHKIISNNQAKFLGLILDKKLLFKDQINSIRKNAYGIISIINCLIGRRSTLSIKNKIILFKMIVLPVMLYAIPVWSNTCESNINKLQIIQNKCLRMICKAGPRDRNSDLHKKCNVRPIREHICDATRKFYVEQIENSEVLNDIRNEFIVYKTKDEMPFRLKYRMPYQILIGQ